MHRTETVDYGIVLAGRDRADHGRGRDLVPGRRYRRPARHQSWLGEPIGPQLPDRLHADRRRLRGRPFLSDGRHDPRHRRRRLPRPHPRAIAAAGAPAPRRPQAAGAGRRGVHRRRSHRRARAAWPCWTGSRPSSISLRCPAAPPRRIRPLARDQSRSLAEPDRGGEGRPRQVRLCEARSRCSAPRCPTGSTTRRRRARR